MPLPENHQPFHDPLEALERLLAHFDQRGVIIGGIAVGLLSQTRFTEDLDAMVLLSLKSSPFLNPGGQRRHFPAD